MSTATIAHIRQFTRIFGDIHSWTAIYPNIWQYPPLIYTEFKALCDIHYIIIVTISYMSTELSPNCILLTDDRYPWPALSSLANFSRPAWRQAPQGRGGGGGHFVTENKIMGASCCDITCCQTALLRSRGQHIWHAHLKDFFSPWTAGISRCYFFFFNIKEKDH